MLVERYVDERRALGELAPGSTRAVRYALRRFVAIVGNMESHELTDEHVRQWLKTADYAPNSGRSRLSHVRMFSQWLIDRGHLRRDPTRGIKSPKRPEHLPRALRRDRVAATFGVCPDARAELIISLEVQECLRAAEVAHLELGDVDFENMELLVNGKGNKQRVVPISDETMSTVERYLDEHPARAGPLIRNYRYPNRGLTPNYISRLSGEWLRAGGTPATGHQLRHTGATDMRRRGVPLEVIQEFLGHKHIESTQIYTGRVVSDELRRAASGRRYRGPLPVDPGQQVLPLAEDARANRRAATP